MVSAAVVYLLKVVEIYEQQRTEILRSLRQGDNSIELFHESVTIRQAGQRVKIGLLLNSGLHPNAVSHILDKGRSSNHIHLNVK